MKIQRRPTLYLILGATVVYLLAYASAVKRGWPGSVIADPNDRIPCPTSYKVDFGIIFYPAHKLDRLIRYTYWNPIVKDLAAEAWASGVFQKPETIQK